MQKPPINLNLLRSLDVVLECRNLTVAAKVLGLTQSALSRQLAQLRQQTGDPLLIREGQRYVLTHKAEMLRAALKTVLANMESVLETPQFDPAQCTRRFSLCGSDYIGEFHFQEIVRRIEMVAPRASLILRAWDPSHYRLLTDEGIDLVPTIADIVPDNLHGYDMGEDRAVCVMRINHPLSKKNRLSLKDYLTWPHISIGGGGDKDSVIDQVLARKDMKRDIRVTVPFYRTAFKLLSEGDYLLTVPDHIAQAMAQNFPLIWKVLPVDVPVYRYWMLWHARNHHDPAHQWFRSQVLDVLRDTPFGVTRFHAAHKNTGAPR